MSGKKFRISIFPPKTSIYKVIETNGRILDNICIRYESTEECNVSGDYTLDAEFYVDHNLSKYINEDCIIKCLIDDEYEIFRIVKCDPSTRYTTVVCKQITITEQKQLWLDDVRPTDTNGLGAIQHLYSNGVGVKEINILSDIDLISTAYYPTMDMYTACYDCDQSFANRWGAEGLETKRRLNNIYLNKRRGGKSNLSIREGKNLTGFKASSNIETFVTRAIGKGFNGIKGHYIESSNKDNYARVNTKVIDYPDVKVRTADMTDDEDGMIFDSLEEAQAELDRRVMLEFTENHIDEIKATYTINFAQLEKTEEYKNYSYLEKADVGDYVKVYVPSLEIDIIVRVMKKKFDGMQQKVSEITLSNTSLSKSISTAKVIENLKKEYANSGNNNIKDYIDAIINAGMKNSNVIIRENEVLIMDTKDINTAKNVWRWNAGGLAHSSEGYYSNNWNIGILQDGSINAEIIRTGILTAILIQSMDGSCSINLETGEANFSKGVIRALNSSWDLSNGIFTTSGVVNGERRQIQISNGSITSNEYLRLTSTGGGVKLSKPFDVPEGWASIDVACYDWGIALVAGFGKKINMLTDYVYSSAANFEIQGDLKVLGNKNCIQKTKEYGDIPFYANEDINSLLSKTPIDEIYETKLYDTCKYKCIIPITQMIRECINTDLEYNVWLTKYGAGDLWVSNTYPGYFVVESDRPIKFKYKLEGKRKNFENNNETKVYKKFGMEVIK